MHLLVGLRVEQRKGSMESESKKGIRASTAAFLLEYRSLCEKYAKVITPIDDTVPLVVRSALDDTIEAHLSDLHTKEVSIER